MLDRLIQGGGNESAKLRQCGGLIKKWVNLSVNDDKARNDYATYLSNRAKTIPTNSRWNAFWHNKYRQNITTQLFEGALELCRDPTLKQQIASDYVAFLVKDLKLGQSFRLESTPAKLNSYSSESTSAFLIEQAISCLLAHPSKTTTALILLEKAKEHSSIAKVLLLAHETTLLLEKDNRSLTSEQITTLNENMREIARLMNTLEKIDPKIQQNVIHILNNKEGFSGGGNPLVASVTARLIADKKASFTKEQGSSLLLDWIKTPPNKLIADWRVKPTENARAYRKLTEAAAKEQPAAHVPRGPGRI